MHVACERMHTVCETGVNAHTERHPMATSGSAERRMAAHRTDASNVD